MWNDDNFCFFKNRDFNRHSKVCENVKPIVTLRRRIDWMTPGFRPIKTLSGLADVFVAIVERKTLNAERKGP